jgi:hypothetical protein
MHLDAEQLGNVILGTPLSPSTINNQFLPLMVYRNQETLRYSDTSSDTPIGDA